MTAASFPEVALWVALFLAGLPAWAALQRRDHRRRARDLLATGAGGRQVADGSTGGLWARVRALAELGGMERPGGPRPVPADRKARPARTGRKPGKGRDLRRRVAVRGAGLWVLGHWIAAEWACLPVGVALGAATWSVVPVVAGAAAVPLVGGALRRRAERAAAERNSVAVSALCGAVAGDLRAGRPPHAALADAVEAVDWPRSPQCARIARLLLSAARFGGDVPGALRAASGLGPGAHGLVAVAACWQVAVDGGAGLAAALDRVAAALQAEADQREDLRAQLAGPRSTAVLLALLPVFGLVLGTGLGAHPSAVLLHHPAGLACLAAGALLEWGGLAWTARIIRGAEGGRP